MATKWYTIRSKHGGRTVAHGAKAARQAARQMGVNFRLAKRPAGRVKS